MTAKRRLDGRRERPGARGNAPSGEVAINLTKKVRVHPFLGADDRGDVRHEADPRLRHRTGRKSRLHRRQLRQCEPHVPTLQPLGIRTKPPMWYSAFPMLRDRYYVWADASKTNSPSATASARLPFRGPRWRRRSRHGSGGRAQGTASDPYASVSPWDQPRAATRTADWWRDALAARPDRPVPSITLATPRVRPPIAAAALDTIL